PFRSYQKLPSYEHIHYHPEALPFLPDPVLRGNLQIVQGELVGLAVEHRPDRSVLDPLRLSEIDEEQAQAFRPLRARLKRRGPRDEHHEVALLDAGDEDLA